MIEVAWLSVIQRNPVTYTCIFFDKKVALFYISFVKSFVSFWLSFTYNETLPGQLIITMSPVIIFKNHTAEQFLVKVKEEEQELDLEIPEQGGIGNVMTCFHRLSCETFPLWEYHWILFSNL